MHPHLWQRARRAFEICGGFSGWAGCRPGGHAWEGPAEEGFQGGFGGAGLGVFVNNVGLISHFGVNRGFRAVFGLPLNAGKGLAVMTNGDNGALVHKSLVERALAREQ